MRLTRHGCHDRSKTCVIISKIESAPIRKGSRTSTQQQQCVQELRNVCWSHDSLVPGAVTPINPRPFYQRDMLAITTNFKESDDSNEKTTKLQST
jgi:hypothetical protein